MHNHNKQQSALPPTGFNAVFTPHSRTLTDLTGSCAQRSRIHSVTSRIRLACSPDLGHVYLGPLLGYRRPPTPTGGSRRRCVQPKKRHKVTASPPPQKKLAKNAGVIPPQLCSRELFRRTDRWRSEWHGVRGLVTRHVARVKPF